MNTDDVSRYIIRTQFGTNLNDDMISSFVSPTLQWIIDNNALQEEGIFRLSGNTHAVESLVNRLNSGESVELRSSGDDEIITRVHDVASLLKYFLRKLPEPIVTSDCRAMFLAVDSIPEQEHEARIDLLRRLISYLPNSNRRLLAMLCRFLHRVVQHSARNKMSAASLGMVFAPALILNMQNRRDQASDLVKEAKAAQKVIAILINDHNAVFGEELIEDVETQKSAREKVHGNDAADGMADSTSVSSDHTKSKECSNKDESEYDESLVLRGEFPALQLDEPYVATRDALMDCNFDRKEASDVATKIKRLSMMLKHELESLDMNNMAQDDDPDNGNAALQGQKEVTLQTIHLVNSNTSQTDSDFAKLHKAVRPTRDNSSCT